MHVLVAYNKQVTAYGTKAASYLWASDALNHSGALTVSPWQAQPQAEHAAL